MTDLAIKGLQNSDRRVKILSELKIIKKISSTKPGFGIQPLHYQSSQLTEILIRNPPVAITHEENR
jgi:hypothetical protein